MASACVRSEPLGDEHAEEPFNRAQRLGGVERPQAEQLKRGRARDREIAQRNCEPPASLAPLVTQLEFVQRLQEPIPDRPEQVLATVEVVIDGHRLNAKRRTQTPHAQRVGPLTLDQRHGAVEDHIPVQRALRRLIRSRRCGCTRPSDGQRLYTVRSS